MVEIQRNAACPCGSGKKYKKCCGKPQDTVVPFGMTQIVACLLKHLGGEAAIDVATIRTIPKGMRVQIFQEGDKIIARLAMEEAEAPPASNIVLPQRKIITP